MNYQKIIFIVFSFTLFFSCSKDKDSQAPIIIIDTPTHLQAINSGDTIKITGTVTDNIEIKSLRIVLKDNNDIPALTAINLQPKTANFTINELYFFDDIHMSSGTYYFDISASDGENSTTKYVEVFVGGVPITRESVFIFDNVANTTSVYRLDNTFSPIFFKSFSGDFIGGVANSYHQQLVSCGSATGKASAIDAEFATDVWSVPLVTAPPTPYFTSIFFDDKTPYLSYYNGDIKGFSPSGFSNFTAHSVSGFHCETAFFHEDFLVTEQVNVTNSIFRFGLYWKVTGAPSQQFLMNEDICGMYSFTPNKIVLISNDASNNGKLSFFSISASGFSSPFSIGTGTIDACEEVGTGLYLIARNGDIRLINAHNFTTQLFLLGVNANLIKYDKITNELFVVSGNNLTVYDYSSKVIKGSYTHSNPILDVAFMYNR